ncbi:hypothetical protein AK812_SmicGene7046 [Symbiodinium microadriaticum]|uniref:Uncharacterized protein n=1 Tax=Symbiodinium microadriaticum TaxID=2951 RepID=A0A1Q9EPH2_SYMMI|nr:hypothetical protein AK812_SmicGene7046 [Symbiodinium microadriaticum]
MFVCVKSKGRVCLYNGERDSGVVDRPTFSEGSINNIIAANAFNAELVLQAVSNSGSALRYVPQQERLASLAVAVAASEVLRGDVEVVTAAVTQHWMALQCHSLPSEPYASEELKDEFDIVQIAVKGNGLALREAGLESQGYD